MNNSKSNNYEIKFLVDAMLGKLARFLRIFGYDTVYANDLEDIFHLSP
ncbi:MAG: Mut7-C RNAse domain-containing protein, partial [Promethearchaeota archaeon]